MSDQSLSTTIRTAMWRQVGASLDMLENALLTCTDPLWTNRLWIVPPESHFPPQFAEFWYITYHVLVWLDLYTSAVPEEEFASPAPFLRGEIDSLETLPAQPYTKEQIHTYLVSLRQKCHDHFLQLSDDHMRRPITYPWADGQSITYLELQLYNLRHIQEHTAQLSLFLGNHGIPGDDLDWVPRAKNEPNP
jgi:hypothetical protein